MLSGKFGFFRATAHPEAANWRTRVIANGGTVSASTFAAVETFCRAIDTAGIRNRFYRLNLFCGTGLAACLVPLYRGQSLGGTQFGNTTDTNANFVSGDYTETGTSGGLGTGSTNSTKSLDTGLVAHTAGIANTDTHLSFYSRGGNTAAGSVMAGGVTTTPFELWQYYLNGTSGSIGQFYRSGGNNNSGIEGAAALRTGHMIAQRSSTGGAIYRNGSNLNLTSTTTNSSTFSASRPPAMRVFARNFGGTVDQYCATTLQAYSIGASMTGSQASDYYNAMQNFQTALSRNL